MGFIKSLLKKYAALLPPAGLLLLALVLLPATLWLGGQVSARMEQSTRDSQALRSLAADVPSAGQPAVIQAYMDRLESEVEQIETLVRHSSQRELVAYDIFPAPTERSSQIFVEYGQAYVQAVNDLLGSLNARDAPSESEIRSQTGTSQRSDRRGGMTTTTRRQTTEQDPMVDALCRARAESISVYASPSVFAWHDYWTGFEFEGTQLALEDSWHAQIALWIYDDVSQTIQAMNRGSEKVSTSPVKRLLGIRFSGPVTVGDDRRRSAMGTGRDTRTSGRRDTLNYITPEKPSNFVDYAWTQRVGDQDYDVVHFAVSVIVDSRYVLDFMRELCSAKEHAFYEDFDPDGPLLQSRRNQISILENSVQVVQKEAPAHALYRYGDAAVMRLDLICEYVLSRDGYDKIKPEPILKQLGQSTSTDTTAPSAPGGGPEWY